MGQGQSQFWHLSRAGMAISPQVRRHRDKLAAAGKRAPADTPHTVRELIAEFRREEWASPHVGDRKPPTLIYGQDPLQMEREFEAKFRAHRDPVSSVGKDGITRTYERALRSDRQPLVAGVGSYPKPIAEMTDDDWLVAHRWADSCVSHLKRVFGANLRTVGAHTDEDYYHVHFYAYADDFHEIHPGYAAKKQAKDAGKTPSECNRGYRVAMQAVQDAYNVEVAAEFGMARIGPARPRVSRAEWRRMQRTKEQMERLAKDNATLRGENEQVASQIKQVAVKAQTLQFDLEEVRDERDRLLRASEDATKASLAECSRADQHQDRSVELAAELTRERHMRQVYEAESARKDREIAKLHMERSQKADAVDAISGRLQGFAGRARHRHKRLLTKLLTAEADNFYLTDLVRRLTAQGAGGGVEVDPVQPKRRIGSINGPAEGPGANQTANRHADLLAKTRRAAAPQLPPITQRPLPLEPERVRDKQRH